MTADDALRKPARRPQYQQLYMPQYSGITGGARGAGIIQTPKSAANLATTGPQLVGRGKMLCKTPGCSFYPEPDLEHFCRNCYEENYEVKSSS